MNKGLFTSNTGEWVTPQELFDELNEEFNFDLDVCATKENAKCKKYYTKQQDGLNRKWSYRNWMNPPYGREISKWVKKAYEEASGENNNITVALLPARTDTKWFHNYIYDREFVQIRFLKGRLKFSNSKNSAPFPSMIVIFK